MIDAVVVGAGPAGGMAARQLAAAGYETVILEKRKVVGEPVQCAEGVSEFGLLSNGLSPDQEWIAQRVAGAKCVAPNGKWFYITRLPGYAIDRAVFDRWMVDGAVDDGAELRTATRVTRLAAHDGGWRIEANGETIDSRVVIGADGPASLVARDAGLVRNLEKILAYEYRFQNEDVAARDPEYFLLFLGEQYKGGYAWIFPNERRTQTIAGTIPYRYDLTSLAAPGLAVVGDAAGITNPMNGAGIHPGIFSGRLAGEFAVASLEKKDPAAMLEYDRVVRSSPFLDPVLWWMIDRARRWTDRLMNTVVEELEGIDWRALTWKRMLGTGVRKPSLVLHAREFYRMIRTLELCDRYGW
ncbi:MAG: NAD(P)/FAD-dependent oxidoreductase [Methanobacteriota archaeon]|nr:MAG: NAD(P)/FAD-dependent oxidoreductase [Euryarchaeota archaeon]